MNTSIQFVLIFMGWLCIYISNRLGYVFPPFIQFYLADLLAIPVVATLSMWFMRSVLQSKDFILDTWHIAFVTIFFSVLFEGILPNYMRRYTSDLVDVLMYVAGAFFFSFSMNKAESG